MLKRDGLLWNFKVWRDGIKWLWGKDGVFRSLVGVYLDFYKKDFHPGSTITCTSSSSTATNSNRNRRPPDPPRRPSAPRGACIASCPAWYFGLSSTH